MDVAKPPMKVLYTHQKTKKWKTWQDGFVKVDKENKVLLLDENKTVISSFSYQQSKLVPGAEFETARYLITVEEVETAEPPPAKKPCTVRARGPALSRPKPAHAVPAQPQYSRPDHASAGQVRRTEPPRQAGLPRQLLATGSTADTLVASRAESTSPSLEATATGGGEPRQDGPPSRSAVAERQPNRTLQRHLNAALRVEANQSEPLGAGAPTDAPPPRPALSEDHNPVSDQQLDPGEEHGDTGDGEDSRTTGSTRSRECSAVEVPDQHDPAEHCHGKLFQSSPSQLAQTPSFLASQRSSQPINRSAGEIIALIRKRQSAT